MQKITTCLWFEDQAEEAAEFYTSIFDDSRIGAIARYDKAGAEASGRPEGSAMTVEFELEGRKFTALNGGPQFKFNESISLVVNCETQEEVDRFWTRLSEGGEEGPCGWLKDRYGLSWQIVPTILPGLLKSKDSSKAQKAMEAMLQMKKLDITELQRAYEQG